MTGELVYAEWMQPLTTLSLEDRGRILTAILEYANGLEPSCLNDTTALAWSFILPALERNRKKYESRVERSRKAAKARWSSDANACVSITSMENETLNETLNENENETLRVMRAIKRAESSSSLKKSKLTQEQIERAKKIKDLDALLDKAAKTPWLIGQNPLAWIASTAWVIDHAEQILAGNYDPREDTQARSQYELDPGGTTMPPNKAAEAGLRAAGML